MVSDPPVTASSALTSPPGLAPRQPKRPISVASLEVVIARAVALFGILFGVQALPLALGQRDQIEPVWWIAMVGCIYGTLVVSGIASVVRRGTRRANAAIALVFLLALLLWVPGVMGEGWSAAERPWLWFMITVATAAAAVALPTWLATVYLLVAPTLYGALRLSLFGGSADPVITALDVLYAVLLGGAVLAIITLLRSAAASVDAAQATALSRYLVAVAEHAREVERVQVDAIVHDTVLSTFLSAGRAETAEHRQQAARLAQNAIVHLRAAEVAPAEDAEGVLAEMVARRVRADAERQGGFTLDFGDLSDTVLPVVAAESLYSAASQAMVNSVQHAGRDDVERWVKMFRRADGGVRLEVGDAGAGFEVEGIPAERLGVRVSIVERMLGAGGEARVESARGEGTLVFIDWPAADASAPVGEVPA